ncbi:HPP family protein [Leucobacter aridicollis]|uniref:HPP family protein n=1 Tax=Leucobacter aridicollis TaxID=283878 RepID=UPI0021083717|nr:HPP family protein [Leucobacter aridicollis]UTX53328.1 HPP family protein [Leucobacter aridicollis]
MQKRWGEGLRALITSTQPRLPWRRIAFAAIGTGAAVALLGALGTSMDLTLLFLGFAPSCLLVFALPEAPVSQPIAVVGGHMVSAAVGLGVGAIPHTGWWNGELASALAGALAAALSVVAMLVLRVLHPPAVANAVVVCVTGAGWSYLVAPVLLSAVSIVVIALVWHRITGATYPHRSAIR